MVVALAGVGKVYNPPYIVIEREYLGRCHLQGNWALSETEFFSFSFKLKNLISLKNFDLKKF